MLNTNIFRLNINIHNFLDTKILNMKIYFCKTLANIYEPIAVHTKSVNEQ